MTRTHTDTHGQMPPSANAARPCLSVFVRVAFSPALCLFLASLALAAEKEAESPFCRIYDTGTRTDLALPAEAFAKREGWRLVPEGNTTHRFTGEAVLVNDKLTLHVPSNRAHAIVFISTAEGLKYRASIGCYLLEQSERGPFDSLKIIENGVGAAMVESSHKSAPEASLRFRVTAADGILEVRPGHGLERVYMTLDAPLAVVPDFLGDDMVFSFTQEPAGVVLPAENSVLCLGKDSDTIAICVWASNRQIASLGAIRRSGVIFGYACDITCHKGASIWLTFLEGKGIWGSGAAGGKKDWNPPFPAKWRCSVPTKVRFGVLPSEDGLAVSYDYEKGPPAGVALPDGPTIIYPIDRTKATPLTTVLPMDVMRSTLGVGPCQYVLQAEGLATEANPTPEQVSHWVEQQFKRKKEKAAAAEIKDRLAQMADHVGRVQARIGQYGGSAKQLRTLCQKHATDEGAARCLTIVGQLEQAAAMKGEEPKAARQLADAVAALIGKENALEECQKLGEELRAIGSAQDAALARCRLHVRRLRAQCATRPDSALSKELEPLVERMLRGK